MKTQSGRVQRQGQIYRFEIDGVEYAAFIWPYGKQFRGRLEGNPQISQVTGRSVIAVRDALKLALTSQVTV